jgi:hypothetical protein
MKKKRTSELRQELRQLFAQMNEHQKENTGPNECDFCSHYLSRMAEIAELAPDVFFTEMFCEAQTRPEGSIKLDVISPETSEKEIETIIKKHTPDAGFSITFEVPRDDFKVSKS